MAYSIWMLEKGNITVSGGGSLDGVTQGDGSHLVGLTITLNNRNWLRTELRDNDPNFDDNDSQQRLDGAQTIDGTLYADNTVVEAEYRLTLRDPNTGLTYDALGYNVNNSSPSYATIEGLAFVGGLQGFPPDGVALEVLSAFEGPGSSGQPAIPATDTAVPCFTAGTLIATVTGPVAVERLSPGEMVLTRDHGAQPVRWIGRVTVTPDQLRHEPALRPIRLRRDAMGHGLPHTDTCVSPQHRLLVSGWQAELLFGEAEVLVAARHLVNDRTITRDPGFAQVSYVHVLFDGHEVIEANGMATESFLPGPQVLDGMEAALRAELLLLFPELSGGPFGHAVRPLLRGWEGAALRG